MVVQLNHDWKTKGTCQLRFECFSCKKAGPRSKREVKRERQRRRRKTQATYPWKPTGVKIEKCESKDDICHLKYQNDSVNNNDNNGDNNNNDHTLILSLFSFHNKFQYNNNCIKEMKGENIVSAPTAVLPTTKYSLQCY